MSSNFGLKEEIVAYWAERAKTFDLVPGHHVSPGPERDVWQELFRDRLGNLKDRRLLELACGTGEFTGLLLQTGANVTGIDLTPGMLERAKGKWPEVPLYLGDAEDTREPSDHYDAAVCRYLVWTLPNPAAALADWFRVLRPGGRLLIVDGDWVTLPWTGRLRRAIGRRLMKWAGQTSPAVDQAAHDRILRQLPFPDGLRAGPLKALLREAGFTDIEVGSLHRIRRTQRKAAGFPRSLTCGVFDDFWMSARKGA